MRGKVGHPATADPSVKRKFTSYRKETDSSLASGQINYAVARYHGARIGRFHRPDPVRGNFRNPQRLNRYAYVTNNPVRYVDPKGRDMVDPANAESFSTSAGGERWGNVVNYNFSGGFQLGSLHYASGSSFNQEAYAAYVANIEAIWQDIQEAAGHGSDEDSDGPEGFWVGGNPQETPRPDQYGYDQCVKLAQSAFLPVQATAGTMGMAGAFECGVGLLAGAAGVFLGGPVGAFFGIGAAVVGCGIGISEINKGTQLSDANVKAFNSKLDDCARQNPQAVHHRGKT